MLKLSKDIKLETYENNYEFSLDWIANKPIFSEEAINYYKNLINELTNIHNYVKVK